MYPPYWVSSKEGTFHWWTNDLLYNFMVTLLGIENAPESDSSLDIASPNYNLPLEKARTLHGKKKLDP